MTPSRLVVVGGSTAAVHDGAVSTKPPIAEYLGEMATLFHECVWIAEAHDAPGSLEGAVPPAVEVEVVRGRGLPGALRLAWRIFRRLDRRTSLMVFLPCRAGPFLPWVRRRAARFVVYLGNDYGMGLSEVPPVRRLARRASYERPLRHADAVIARGRRLLRIVRSVNPRAVLTVPLAHVRTAGEAPSLADPSELRLLFIGKLVQAKGVFVLLDAVERLRRTVVGRRVALVLVGAGEDEITLRRRVQERGLAEAVRFEGWVGSSERIDRLLRESHVLVVPTTTYPEGVPRVVDEAIVRRVPVVATRVGGIPDEFPDGEVALVAPGNATALADAILTQGAAGGPAPETRAAMERRREWLVQSGSPAAQHAKILLDTNRLPS